MSSKPLDTMHGVLKSGIWTLCKFAIRLSPSLSVRSRDVRTAFPMGHGLSWPEIAQLLIGLQDLARSRMAAVRADSYPGQLMQGRVRT